MNLSVMWNLERWYWWTHLQGSDVDTGTQYAPVDSGWEEEGGLNWDGGMETNTLPYAK